MENPDGKCKFASTYITVNSAKQMSVRQTYGLLDYFGDIGGLIDFLFYLATFILQPFSQFIYSHHILTKLFRTKSERTASTLRSNQLS